VLLIWNFKYGISILLVEYIFFNNNNNNNNNNLFTAIGLLLGGSGYFTCKQNMKLVTTECKSEGLHEKHVVETWNLGNHLSIDRNTIVKAHFILEKLWQQLHVSAT